MSVRAILEEDLEAVLERLVEQADKHGHTAESDAELPIGVFADKLQRGAGEAADVMRPGDRQNLEVAYRRCAREAAMALATMRRIRLEQARQS